jgi:hypothetical protein
MKHARVWRQWILILAIAAALVQVSARGETGRRIKLPAAGKSARIAGEIHGVEEKREFTFNALKGTKLKIELSGDGPLRGQVTFPSGNYTGSPGGIILDEVLQESGRYQLEVRESPMGEAWNGAFRVTISVGE